MSGHSQDGLRVSVVIPVLNAERFLEDLLPAIFAQRPAVPDEVILVDSNSTDGTVCHAEKQDGVRVLSISDFSHGRSRNLGARESRGDVVVLLSQDALPFDNAWLKALVGPLSDPGVAAVFSRQVPRVDANPMERYFLQTHFPAGDPIFMRRSADEDLSFQKGVFFSNVSAAIRRSALIEHPFDEELIMSEDQQFARDVLQAGLAVVYEPRSVVYHSHNYTPLHAFRRYFDSVYSLTKIFEDQDMGASASLGMRYVKDECKYIARKYPHYLPYYFFYNLSKATATIAAHHAESMPRWLARACSLHRYYWESRERTATECE